MKKKKRKERGEAGGSQKVRPYFIAPRISCHSSKRAPRASLQRDSTRPGAAPSYGVTGASWQWGGPQV